MAADPYRYFRVEAREIVERLGQGVLALEKAEDVVETISRLFRLAHTLKGAARVVKHARIAELAHGVEDLLGPLRGEPRPVSREEAEALLAQVDEIGRELAKLPAEMPAPEAAGPRIAAEPARAEPPRPDEPFRTLKTDVGEVDELLDSLSEAAVSVGSLRGPLASFARVRGLAALLRKQLAAPTRADRAAMLLLGEQIERGLGTLERDFTGGVDRASREVKQVRASAERLRLLPAGALFPSLERAVRDAARATGKDVQFSGRGHDVRIDSHVLGEVQGALVQLVRNAVAHGIESARDRAAAGKPVTGVVEVTVSRRAGRVAFLCRDDGRGVDTEALRRAARAKGMDVPGSEDEALALLLLRGGLTTAATVTELAGRGVGLDVVREIAQRLGGELAARSRPGAGTEIELDVKISLSSMTALLVEVGGNTAAIPLDAVRATTRITREDVLRSSGTESIAHDGTVIPFVLLERALASHVPAREGSRAGRAVARSAVIVNAKGRDIAVGVERLSATEEVVLRPLDPMFSVDPIVAGVCIDGEGNPRLVLDIAALGALATRQEGEEASAGTAPAAVLVVDDSLTTRMLEMSILESAGYEVELAVSGEEGLEKARRGRFALFLVDVEMPGIDGFTFIERIRSDPALRGTPAILVTSRDSPEDRRRGVEVGANDYMVKSAFDQVRLLAVIRRLLEANV